MTGKPWYAVFITAWRWGMAAWRRESFIAIAAHTLFACVLIGCIKIVQQLVQLVLAIGVPGFDIPLRYLFDGMNVGILVAFIFFGTVEATIVFVAPEPVTGAGNRLQLAYWRWMLKCYVPFMRFAGMATFVPACLYVHPVPTVLFLVFVVPPFYRRR